MIILPELAEITQMHPNYFCVYFKNLFKISPLQYVQKIRMNYAKELLTSGMNVNYVADELGYSDAYCFSHAYKRFFGSAPENDKGRAE